MALSKSGMIAASLVAAACSPAAAFQAPSSSQQMTQSSIESTQQSVSGRQSQQQSLAEPSVVSGHMAASGIATLAA
eukprot:CAMPEP_0178434332 /NCGR_PEP_ID=MMETSP0689_2-20121128/33370_1 /TAXON_ID=160604 /ORGANISM="Amphidinium massartii, Strain CS-259" /LENGTH=75 /DNA_ID=CAMNT_0020056395 /DNA_START=104 /DNA_END=327 /DNA_ORIENTATION=+